MRVRSNFLYFGTLETQFFSYSHSVFTLKVAWFFSSAAILLLSVLNEIGQAEARSKLNLLEGIYVQLIMLISVNRLRTFLL